MTADLHEAREWFEVLPQAMGVEGLVVKEPPTFEGWTLRDPSDQPNRETQFRYRQIMAGWESLRADLRQLLEESPDALVVFPDPDSERRERPIHIELAAWATDIAAALIAKYESLVDLRVGAMTFPTRRLWVNEHVRQLRGAPAESAGLEVEPLAPLSIRSGRSRHEDVLVTNRAAHEQVLLTNGALTSAVTDSSGTVVGLYVGPHTLARVGFAIEPDQSRPVPVLIGTATVIPDLGYAVPPGQWRLVIAPQTDSGSMLSAPLEITITP